MNYFVSHQSIKSLFLYLWSRTNTAESIGHWDQPTELGDAGVDQQAQVVDPGVDVFLVPLGF